MFLTIAVLELGTIRQRRPTSQATVNPISRRSS
jgi:hypothetical protein